MSLISSTGDGGRWVSGQFLPISHWDLMGRVGANHKYQKYLLHIMGVIWMLTGALTVSLPFLFRQYEFDCNAHGLAIDDYECEMYVCALGKENWSGYVSPTDSHFKSITTGGDYLCSNDEYVYLSHLSAYIGGILGLAVMGSYADNYGRKKAMFRCWIVLMVGAILTTASLHLHMTTVGLLLCGAGLFPSAALSLCFFSEVVSAGGRQSKSTVVQLYMPVGGLLATVLFYLIDEWRVVWGLLITLPVIVQIFLLHFYVQETPKFLLLQGAEAATKAFNRIGRINMARQQTFQQEQISQVMDCQLTEAFKHTRVYPIDLFRFSSVRGISVALLCTSWVTVVMSHGPTEVIGAIGFDIFTTFALDQLSQFFIVLLAVIFVIRIRRRRVGLIVSVVAIFCSGVLLFYESPGECDFCYQNFIQLTIFVIFKSTNSFFSSVLLLYVCQAYPNTIRATALAFHMILGQLALIITPIILSVLKYYDLDIMMFFLMFAFLNLVAVDFLPETKDKALIEDFQELQSPAFLEQMVAKYCPPRQRKNKNSSLISMGQWGTYLRQYQA